MIKKEKDVQCSRLAERNQRVFGGRGQYSVAYNFIWLSGRIPTGNFPEHDKGLFALTHEYQIWAFFFLQMQPWLKLAHYDIQNNGDKFLKFIN